MMYHLTLVMIWRMRKLSSSGWRSILGIDSRYQVNEYGDVRKTVNGKHIPISTKSGYVEVSTDSGNRTKIYVDYAVASAFVPNPDNKCGIFHLDQCKDNCVASNLVWANISDVFEPKTSDIEGEIWKYIPEYANKYQASNLGRIRSMSGIESYTFKGTTFYRMRIGKVLKPYVTGQGYLTVNPVSLDGRVIPKSVHRLVASTFIPNPNNFPQVNHIDGNKQNNNASNLEWVTREGNMQHAKIHKLWDPKLCGMNSAIANGKRVVCVTDGHHFLSVTAAARFYGMDYNSVIESIETGRSRKGFTFNWDDSSS